MMLALVACVAPWVIDGDSIRCRNLGEVRLLGIDAPDYRSSRPCRGRFGDHVCDDRGARAAKLSLIAGLTARRLDGGRGNKRLPVTVEPVARDRYGRTVGSVSAGATNLSCWQLERGTVRYIVKYDNGGRIARACGR